MTSRWLYLVGLLSSLTACPIAAQNYPSRIITMVVPYPAGGPTDLVARLVGNRMSKELGQQIIVENVGGASGTIGATRVARAAPDGYTLLMHNITFASAPALYKNRTYDPLKDFSPIGLVAETPQAIVTKKAMAAKDMGELIAHIKREKENINLADAGRGSGSYLCNLFFAHSINTPMTTISYRGTGPALNDMLAGQVDLMCDQVANTVEQIKAGNIRAYCVTTRARLDMLPSVPTCEEAGVRHLETSVWVALLGPAGIPQEAVAKLAFALRQALHDPTVVQRLAGLATTVVSDDLATPDGLGTFLGNELDKWGKTFAAMHVTPE